MVSETHHASPCFKHWSTERRAEGINRTALSAKRREFRREKRETPSHTSRAFKTALSVAEIIHASRCLAGLRDAQWSTGAARLCARCDCACPCACVKHPAQRTKSSVRVGMVGVRRVAAGSAAHLTVRGIQLTPILELIIRGVSCAARVWQSPWLCTACGWSSCGPLPRRGYGVPGLFGRLAFSAGRRLGRLRRHCRRAHARCIGNSGG